MPWVRRFSPGKSAKNAMLFGAGFHKIVDGWWEIGRFFALGGQVFAGEWTKDAVLFRGDITQKRGAVLGNRAVFFLGGAVFAGRLHKSAVLFR